ncbi:MAG: hypothetical protein ABFE01_22005 [Phycisphaerales bacterium]
MSHDGDHDRRGKRFRLKVRHVILGILAVLLVAGILHVAILSSKANRRIEALRAAGQPTSMGEWTLRNKLPMGMDNAAPLYTSAFAAYVHPAGDANVPYLGRAREPSDRKAAFPEPVARDIASFLAANEKCLSLLHQAAGIQDCRYDSDYRREFPHFKELRGCALSLKMAIIYHAQKGDAESVVACFRDALRLGDSLQREPGLMPFVMHMSCTGAAITGLERALNMATFTDSQLKDLDDALAATAGATDLAQALISERCYLIELIRDPSLTEATRPASLFLKLPGVRSSSLIDILDHMGASIEAAGLPYAQQAARFREIDKRLRGLSKLHAMAQVVAPTTLRFGELNLRRCAHVDMARTSLAIERFRLATGGIPAQLTDLVPKYLDRAPLDPFDGQPLRYRRTEPGYVLYSIMEDGKDNGGKERDEVGKDKPYDLCFIVSR